MEELYRLLKASSDDAFQDVGLNRAWNNARLLEDREQMILENTMYSRADILYSRYYWLTSFIVLYEPVFGRNESLRQAQFKIIEFLDWTEEVNSEILEGIDLELGFMDE